MKYIGYFRVSTLKQGNSTLGLESQRTDVNKFIAKGGELIAEFQDIESGKKDNRPNLLKPLRNVKNKMQLYLLQNLTV